MSYDTYEKIMRTNCFYGYFHIQVLQPWCTHRLVSFHIDVKNNRKNHLKWASRLLRDGSSAYLFDDNVSIFRISKKKVIASVFLMTIPIQSQG